MCILKADASPQIKKRTNFDIQKFLHGFEACSGTSTKENFYSSPNPEQTNRKEDWRELKRQYVPFPREFALFVCTRNILARAIDPSDCQQSTQFIGAFLQGGRKILEGSSS